jgi:cytochrome o ubiquinol oxidase subunit 2
VPRRSLIGRYFVHIGLRRTYQPNRSPIRPPNSMGRRGPRSRGWLFFFTALCLVPLSGCDVLKFSVMNHAGPIAAGQWHLYKIVGIVLIFVAGPVLLLTPLIAWHYRLANKDHAFKSKWNLSWVLEAFIWIPPVGIVIGLSVVLWRYTHMLDPYRPIGSNEPALELQAVALDWKWLIIYPQQHIAAVNQMVIPVGRPVHISLTSGTVMQSLLIPQLAGQIYAMAGMTTQLNLAASRTGVYRGENTQYNGIGFQNETLNVIALSPADYDHWIAHAGASTNPLDPAALAELLRQSSPPRPIVYSSVPQNLFQRILAQSTETGS